MPSIMSRILIAACIAIFGTAVVAIAAPPAQAPAVSAKAGWERTPADLRAHGGSRIRAIHHPAQMAPMTRARKEQADKPHLRRNARPAREFQRPDRLHERRPDRQRKAAVARDGDTADSAGTRETTTSTSAGLSFIHVLTIDSPPIDGFVPRIAVVATDESSGELILDAVPSTSVGGTAIQPADQEESYAIGLFDTGAGAHVMANGAGVELGLFANNLLTTNTITITGVTGSVDARVSYPIGLYIDGIDAIDASTLLLDTTGMVGETNVAIAVGQTPAPGAPDLPTAIGSPLSVFYAATFDNEQVVTRTIDTETYESPLIEFFETDDPLIPEYPNFVPLELRPLGGVAVQYTPCIDIFGSCPLDAPQSPSVIIGNSAQSLFFVSSVDCYNATYSAIDKDRFMLDTGAQVTVIGNRVGARLNLDPANPDFLVEIEGVTGDISMEPGFYIDRLEIPALGEWLTYTNVPVVLLDVASPEGGTLDGIIGMNLFLEFNFVLRGGGLFLQPDPSLEYEPVTLPAINVDFDGDGDVDLTDFAFFQRCMTESGTTQTEPGCAQALLDADSDVDETDLNRFQACFSGPAVPAGPMCTE